MFVFGHSLSLLQVLERTTAGLTKQALQVARSVSDAAKGFSMKARVCTSDAAPSNDLAEKLLASELGPSWCLVHLHCNVHKIAAVHSHSLAQVQQHIQGVVNFALALLEASAMMPFDEPFPRWSRRSSPFALVIPAQRVSPTASSSSISFYPLGVSSALGVSY